MEEPLETIPLNYQFAEFTLDVARGCVLKDGEEIKLRPKVYEALKYLLDHRGRLVTKQELMEAVWPGAFVTDDSLVQCTLELRRALGDRGQQLLRTVPRRGYVFSAEVTLITDQAPLLSVHASVELCDGPKISPARIPAKRHELPVPRTSLAGNLDSAVRNMSCPV